MERVLSRDSFLARVRAIYRNKVTAVGGIFLGLFGTAETIIARLPPGVGGWWEKNTRLELSGRVILCIIIVFVIVTVYGAAAALKRQRDAYEQHLSSQSGEASFMSKLQSLCDRARDLRNASTPEQHTQWHSDLDSLIRGGLQDQYARDILQDMRQGPMKSFVFLGDPQPTAMMGLAYEWIIQFQDRINRVKIRSDFRQ